MHIYFYIFLLFIKIYLYMHANKIIHFCIDIYIYIFSNAVSRQSLPWHWLIPRISASPGASPFCDFEDGDFSKSSF